MEDIFDLYNMRMLAQGKPQRLVAEIVPILGQKLDSVGIGEDFVFQGFNNNEIAPLIFGKIGDAETSLA